jgi:hypothetical protein
MAEQTEQAARMDVSPLRSRIIKHPIATFLVLVYATTTALVFVPKGLTEPGLLPGGATPHGVLENVLGSAVPAFIVTALISGRRAGPRPAQLPVAGAAPLVSDQPARSAAGLIDRRHDPLWLRAAARSRPELVASLHRIPAGIGDHDLAEQCR